jgi:NAD(P)-dependent dehydrogenase (short-subunit alcohol dehydrogenase family)
VLADRDETTLNEAVGQIGGDTLPLVLDVSDVQAVQRTIPELVKQTGRLDGLINNAGLFKNERLLDVDEAGFDRLMSVNVKGAFFVLQACARAMLECGNGGVIVNLASAAGRSGRPTQPIYGMTKACMIHLTKSAAMALAPSVRVVCVCPAAIETDMWQETLKQRREVGGEADVAALFARIPLARSGSVEELADVIAFLCSPGASFVTGACLDVSGGLEMN